MLRAVRDSRSPSHQPNHPSQQGCPEGIRRVHAAAAWEQHKVPGAWPEGAALQAWVVSTGMSRKKLF